MVSVGRKAKLNLNLDVGCNQLAELYVQEVLLLLLDLFNAGLLSPKMFAFMINRIG